MSKEKDTHSVADLATTEEEAMNMMLQNIILENVMDKFENIFMLNKNHPNEEINVMIKDNIVSFKTQSNVEYKADKMIVTIEEWERLNKWLNKCKEEGISALMPRTKNQQDVNEVVNENELLNDNEETSVKEVNDETTGNEQDDMTNDNDVTNDNEVNEGKRDVMIQTKSTSSGRILSTITDIKSVHIKLNKSMLFNPINKNKVNLSKADNNLITESQTVKIDEIGIKINKMTEVVKQYCDKTNEAIIQLSDIVSTTLFTIRNVENRQKEMYEELKLHRLQLSTLIDDMEKQAEAQELKRCETNMTTAMIRQKLYSLQYIPDKESSSDFCEKFEDIIRNYENISGAVALSEEEKRDAFYIAIMTTVPEIQAIEFLTKNTTGKGLTYDKLKMFIIQAEANKNKTKNTETRATLTTKRSDIDRCYECDDVGHLSYDCPRKNSGLRKCYECNQFTNHTARQCRQRQGKPAERRVGRGSRYTGENNKHGYVKHSLNNKTFNDRCQPQKRKNYEIAKGSEEKKPKFGFVKGRSGFT